MTGIVRDARPPLTLVRILNPIMRAVLRTPLAVLVRPFALIEFTGRRSGKRYLVPVGWHRANDDEVVFSPAAWRVNFEGGIPVTVRYRGRRRAMTGTLVSDPEQVAVALQDLFDAGGSARQVGIAVPGGHTITADDVRHVNRAAIFFTIAD